MYLFFLYYGKIRKFESIIFHIDRLQKQIVVEWESLKKKKISIKIEKKEKKIDVKEKKQTREKKREEIC